MTQSYEQEQAKLQAEYEGEPQDEDLHVPNQLPEVNPELYKDMESLLFNGFLTVPAQINGVSFVFKSLNHHEFHMLSLGAQGNKDYYNQFLAYGVFVLDGLNILPDRSDHLPELADFFKGISKPVKHTVVRHLSEINRRANRSVILTEAFCMESRSRMRWAQLKGLDLTTTAVSGILGTETLGLNWGQMTWRALNHYEDQRETSEREWENAKFTASPMAGKGMNKIYSQDKRRRKSDFDERVARREKLIRHVLLNEPLEGKQTQGVTHVARSTKELYSQLESDLKGEQDWHDRVIASFDEKEHAKQVERANFLQDLRAKNDEKFGEKGLMGGTEILGLSKEEVDRQIAQRHKDIARGLANQARFPELHDEKYAELQDKWGKPIVQQPHSVMPAGASNRPQTKPFKR